MSPDVELVGHTQPGSHPPSRLVADQVLGDGRYRVTALSRTATFGEVYRATDTQADAPVGIYLVAQELVTDEVTPRLQQACAAAAGLSHKNLVACSPLVLEGEFAYLVTEWVDGNAVAELVARKRQSGTTFSAKGAYNVLAHACNALTAAHGTLGHGAIYPGAILVNKAGRVKLMELGIAAATPAAVAATAAAAYMAPELAQGSTATAASDIYSLGALLYELLTGAPPKPGSAPPSQAVPGLPAAIDQVVGRAVARDPGQRFPSADALKDAVHEALGAAAHSGRQAAVKPATAAAAQPSLAQQLTAPAGASAAQARTSGASAAQSLSDTQEKYLIHRDRMDYGPFSLAQIAHQIETNEIRPGNYIVDNETGDRQLVEEHPLLHDLVDRAKGRRDHQRRAQAEILHAKTEKRRGGMLYVVIVAGVVALGGGAYFIVDAMSEKSAVAEDATIVAIKEGGYEAKITLPSKPSRRKGKRRGRGGGGGSSGGSAGGGNDEWENNDLGDVSSGGGGDERLDVGTDINPVIQRHGGKLARCLGGGASHAQIQFIVRGNGRVSYVRVNGQRSGPLYKCINGAMRSMQFPTFNGSRTRAEFEISR